MDRCTAGRELVSEKESEPVDALLSDLDKAEKVGDAAGELCLPQANFAGEGEEVDDPFLEEGDALTILAGSKLYHCEVTSVNSDERTEALHWRAMIFIPVE